MDPYREAGLITVVKKQVPKDFGARLQKISAENLNSDDCLPGDLREWLQGTVVDTVAEIATTGATKYEMTYPWTDKPYMDKTVSWCRRHKLKCEFVDRPGRTAIIFSWAPRKYVAKSWYLLVFNIFLFALSFTAIFFTQNIVVILALTINIVSNMIFAIVNPTEVQIG